MADYLYAIVGLIFLTVGVSCLISGEIRIRPTTQYGPREKVYKKGRDPFRYWTSVVFTLAFGVFAMIYPYLLHV